MQFKIFFNLFKNISYIKIEFSVTNNIYLILKYKKDKIP